MFEWFHQTEIEEFEYNLDKNNQNNGHYEDDTINPSTNETEDDENDDDDCQIISDTEEVVTKPKPGLHVNDDLNIPDSNGKNKLANERRGFINQYFSFFFKL